MVSSHQTTTLARRLVAVLEFCLIGIIAFLLVKLVIILTTPKSAWKSHAPVNITSQTHSGQGEAHQTFAEDFSFDPFHRTSPQAVDPILTPGIGEDAPETTLNLRLYGLRTGPAGSAIIETPDNTQTVYKIGDEVISGVVLKSVSARYIVLDQNGQLERLTFEQGEGTVLLPSLQTENDSLTSIYLPNSRRRSDSSMSPQTLIQAVPLTPVTKGGRVLGYRLKSHYPISSLPNTGLQPNDIITKIGATDLRQDHLDMNALLAQINQSQSIQLGVIRNGKSMLINLGSQ